MLGKAITLCKSTRHGSWQGGHSCCATEAFPGCLERIQAELLKACTSQLYSVSMLLVQGFIFQLSLHTGFIKRKGIYTYIFVLTGKIIMVM